MGKVTVHTHTHASANAHVLVHVGDTNSTPVLPDCSGIPTRRHFSNVLHVAATTPATRVCYDGYASSYDPDKLQDPIYRIATSHLPPYERPKAQDKNLSINR